MNGQSMPEGNVDRNEAAPAKIVSLCDLLGSRIEREEWRSCERPG